ncbi:hypothetical protein ACOMHN_019492 [Nucella lapillus]
MTRLCDDADDEEDDDDDSIIGGVVAGIVIFIIIIACVVWHCCRRRRNDKRRNEPVVVDAPTSSRSRATDELHPPSLSVPSPEANALASPSPLNENFYSTIDIPLPSKPQPRGQKEGEYNRIDITRNIPEVKVATESVDGGDGGGKLYDRLHADPSVYSQLDRNRKPEVVNDDTYSHIP